MEDLAVRLLDLFCGRWGWSRAFARRGWDCLGVDLHRQNAPHFNCHFMREDVLNLTGEWAKQFDFIVASPPCEQFAVHGLRMWHRNAKYPSLGIELFNHTRSLCESSKAHFVIENVRSAELFVGRAEAHCGPFYLWGNAVPPLLHKGITKGGMIWSPRYRNMKKSLRKQEVATIPEELAGCVADYAERLLEAQIKAFPSDADYARAVDILGPDMAKDT